MNIPIGIVSILMTRAFIFDPPYMKDMKRRVDGIGIGLLAVGIGTLQFLLDKGQTEDWFDSNLIRALAVASASA